MARSNGPFLGYRFVLIVTHQKKKNTWFCSLYTEILYTCGGRRRKTISDHERV